MSEMINRVAQAMFTASGRPFTEYAMNSELRKGYEVFAKAAIEALREPTREMLEAGMAALNPDYYGRDSKDVWQLMIDESLK